MPSFYSKGKYRRGPIPRPYPKKRVSNKCLIPKIRHMSDDSSRNLTNNRETRQYLRDMYREMQRQINQQQEGAEPRQEVEVAEPRILDPEAGEVRDNSLIDNETQTDIPPYRGALGSAEVFSRPATPQTLPDLVQSRGVNNLDSSTIPDTVTSLGESAANRVIADYVHLLHGDINYVVSPDGQTMPDPTGQQMEKLTDYFTEEKDIEKAQDVYNFFATMVERANTALIQQSIVDQAIAIEQVQAVGNSEQEIEQNIAQTTAYYDRVRNDNHYWFDTTMGSLNASTYASSLDITRRHLHEEAPSLGGSSDSHDNESSELESIYAPASTTNSNTNSDFDPELLGMLSRMMGDGDDQDEVVTTESESESKPEPESTSTVSDSVSQETRVQTPTEYVAELEQETPADFGWSGEE